MNTRAMPVVSADNDNVNFEGHNVECHNKVFKLADMQNSLYHTLL